MTKKVPQLLCFDQRACGTPDCNLQCRIQEAIKHTYPPFPINTNALFNTGIDFKYIYLNMLRLVKLAKKTEMRNIGNKCHLKEKTETKNRKGIDNLGNLSFKYLPVSCLIKLSGTNTWVEMQGCTLSK